MSTINCTFDEFKRMAKEFLDACAEPGWTMPQIDNGWKCLTLAYLGLSEPEYVHSAAIVLNLAGQQYLKRIANH